MLLGVKIFQFHLRRPCWGVGSTDGLAHADLGGDEELLHGHHVHPGEVLLHELLAVVPVAQAEVLLEVDPEFCDHDRVFQVSLHPLKTLDALVTSVPGVEIEVNWS